MELAQDSADDAVSSKAPAQREPTSKSRGSPLRAPLNFRVGVVGHRPDRLGRANPDQLAGVIGTILGIVKEEVLAVRRDCQRLYSGAAPVVRAISPLAEGTDRIFAETALSLGFELCCVMPFHQSDFEKDFEPGKALESDSLNRFHRLLERATTQFELDGIRDDEGAAYNTCGRVVLNQSDVLIVVWDGMRRGKGGGTEQTLDEACRSGVPVVWVDASAPHSWRMLDATSLPRCATAEPPTEANAAGSVAALHKCVRDAVDLPKPLKSNLVGAHMETENTMRNLQVFYEERQPRWTMSVLWKGFQNFVADGKVRGIALKVAPFEESAKMEWPEDRSSPVGRMVDWLRPVYAWPDKLAVLYADRYRSAFIMAFLLSAAAVGMALLPVGAQLESHHWAETTSTALELAAILVILAMVVLGQRRRWHERWIEYRLILFRIPSNINNPVKSCERLDELG